MEGDFTRSSDDPDRSYSGVLMQQGRVQLDADWNEQWAIHTRALRLALKDIIGQHGGPAGDLGFQIAAELPDGVEASRVNPNTDKADIDFFVSQGTYYVDGIRIVLPDWRRVETGISPGQNGASFLAYLEVWERHVNAVEDPAIREIALLGPDTATRAEVVWRVNLLRLERDDGTSDDVNRSERAEELVRDHLRSRRSLRLAARAFAEDASSDPCKLAPGARYRGHENQLYRLEIHRGVSQAAFAGEEPLDDQTLFTFKWSRDNGSVVFPIESYSGPDRVEEGKEISVTVKVAHLGRDARFGLTPGDIVEFVHDGVTRGGVAVHEQGQDDLRQAGALGRVTAIDPETRDVTVTVIGSKIAKICVRSLHPYLRRWDHGASGAQAHEAGALPVTLSQLGTWIPLEDGVQVRFERPERDKGLRVLRAGDFWLIPARTATGDVLWPTEASPSGQGAREASFRPPHGVVLHHAPLAFVTLGAGQRISNVVDVRKRFAALAQVPPT
ncbi:DUF6519 domain-containing protein [Sorangium sp. So ce296]|uniref:DUF6519 domain-containing protein n=1 Tax=Sorangium sp. So ce296 TaxID=3133296 RepID=UPI003F62481B